MTLSRDNIPVIIVDDDEAVRDSLSIFLSIHGYTVTVFASALDFLAADDLPKNGCILADVLMPGLSGIDMIRAIRDRGCMLPVLIITGHGDIPMAVAALRAGALDFIEKPLQDQILLERIKEASTICRRAMAKEQAHLAVADRFAQLTQREREVMALVVEGHANKIIGARLGISIRTVEIHRARVMQKMGAGSLSELVRLALQIGQSNE